MIRFTLTIWLILLLAVTSIMGCGCSGNMLVPPAYGFTNDDCHVWPIFYGTDNGGPDNGIIVFWDQNGAAWRAPRTVDTDLLNAQWTPQRNAIGWRGGAPGIPGGKLSLIHI